MEMIYFGDHGPKNAPRLRLWWWYSNWYFTVVLYLALHLIWKHI